MSISSDSWLVLCENDGWWVDGAFPGPLNDQVSSLIDAGNTIENVVLDPSRDDAWLVVCSGNCWVWQNVDPGLVTAIGNMIAGGSTLKDVTIGPDGSDQWVTIFEGNGWVANNIPSDLYDQIGAFADAGYTLEKVVISPSDSNAWLIVCAGNGWYASGDFPQDAYAKIGELMNDGLVLESFVFNPDDTSTWLAIFENNGWWVSDGFPQPVTDRITALMDGGLTLRNVSFAADASGWTGAIESGDSPTASYQDSRGYWFDETADWWKQMCLSLPCCLLLQWPDYATATFETTLNGQPAVIQTWKGYCEKFLGDESDFPGGVGGEVGVYRRIPGMARNVDLSRLPEPLAALIAAALALPDDQLWWPAPELADSVQFTLVNPDNGNQTFFDAGPEDTYWMCKWMTADSYSQYETDQGLRFPWLPADIPGNSANTPLFSVSYVMNFAVNGQTFTW